MEVFSYIFRMYLSRHRAKNVTWTKNMRNIVWTNWIYNRNGNANNCIDWSSKNNIIMMMKKKTVLHYLWSNHNNNDKLEIMLPLMEVIKKMLTRIWVCLAVCKAILFQLRKDMGKK